jgi:hypothetical protein
MVYSVCIQNIAGVREDVMGETTAIENSAIAMAGRGIIRRLQCGTSRRGTRFDGAGANKGGKHSSPSSFLAYNVVPPVV